MLTSPCSYAENPRQFNKNLNSTHRTRDTVDTIIHMGVFSGNKTGFVRMGHYYCFRCIHTTNDCCGLKYFHVSISSLTSILVKIIISVVSLNAYIIKTHNNELRSQEEAGCMRQTSEFNVYMYVASTAVEFVNALNKLSLKISLSYQGFSTF